MLFSTTVDDAGRITFRLFESRRVDGKVRQHNLLNLGRHLMVDRENWPLLCHCIEDLLSGRTAFDLAPPNSGVETGARPRSRPVPADPLIP